MGAVADPVNTVDVEARAYDGGRVIVFRYVVVGLLSFGGGIVLIRVLGPEAWATYSVAYFLIVFLEQTFSTRLLGSLCVGPPPAAAALRAAAALLQSAGLIFLLVFLVLGQVVDRGATALPSLGLALTAVGVAAYVAALRALPVMLRERRLEYRWVVGAEILDQITFYAVAIPLALSDAGLGGVILALAVRGIPAMVLLRWRSPATLAGRLRRSESLRILAFALPALGSGAILLVEGLVPIGLLSADHPTELAFIMTSATLVGYAAVVQFVTQRVGFTTLSLLSGDRAQLAATTRRAYSASVFALVSMVVPMTATSVFWLPLLFGDRWESAAGVTVAMGAGAVCNGALNVLTGAVYALGQPRAVWWLSIAGMATFIPLAWAGSSVSVLLGVAVAWAVSRAFCLGGALAMMRRRGCPVAAAREWLLILGGTLVAGVAVASVHAGQMWPAVALAVPAVAAWAGQLRHNRTWIRRALRHRRPSVAVDPRLI